MKPDATGNWDTSSSYCNREPSDTQTCKIGPFKAGDADKNHFDNKQMQCA